MQLCCQKDEKRMGPDRKQASPAKWKGEKRAKGHVWDAEVAEKLGPSCQPPPGERCGDGS